LTTRPTPPPRTCGHPDHPEQGNVGELGTQTPRAERGADVEAHRSDPTYFVGRCVKLCFATEGECEYMWVAVDAVETVDGAPELQGWLCNTPVNRAVKRIWRWGEWLGFRTHEIIDVDG
jgi:hypothetical protein